MRRQCEGAMHGRERVNPRRGEVPERARCALFKAEAMDSRLRALLSGIARAHSRQVIAYKQHSGCLETRRLNDYWMTNRAAGRADAGGAVYTVDGISARTAVAGKRVLRHLAEGGYTPSANSFNNTGDRNVFSISRLQHLLQLMPWGAFDRAVQQHAGDRHCKGFDSRDHLLAMTFAQLSSAKTLRKLEDTFNQHARHHYHLGTGPIKRSTLSEANRRRDPQIFAATAMALMERAGRQVRRERKFMTYLLDSTTITLSGRGFEWTAAQATRSKGLKLHLLYASDGCRPVSHSITPVDVNDIDEGKRIAVERGATYVFDKGYCDYSWWSSFCKGGASFVTRLKKNAALVIVEQRPIEQSDAQVILSDEVANFKYKSNRGRHRNNYEGKVRRIKVARPDEEPLILVTNDLQRPASEIAALYKERWQIELFFKWIKQNLEVKRFLGRTENAVRIQLLVALISYLLVLLYRQTHHLKESLYRVLNILKGGLMHRQEPPQSAWQRKRAEQAYLAKAQPLLL
jgi:putative transposase